MNNSGLKQLKLFAILKRDVYFRRKRQGVLPVGSARNEIVGVYVGYVQPFQHETRFMQILLILNHFSILMMEFVSETSSLIEMCFFSFVFKIHLPSFLFFFYFSRPHSINQYIICFLKTKTSMVYISKIFSVYLSKQRSTIESTKQRTTKRFVL